MFYAMESFKEGCTMYQRAVRIKPFATLEKAIQHAQKRAKGKPFVCQGVKVVWA